MKYHPSEPRPYRRRGKKQPGRWEIDLRGTLDNGLTVERERRVFPVNPSAGKVGKRQAAAMAEEEFQRWNRYGQVLRPGEKPPLPRTGAMTSATAPTFAQFAPDFMEFCASPNAGPRGPNSPSGLTSKEIALRLHLLPAFGSLRMDALTRRDVDRYVIDKDKAGRSRNSICNDLTTLRRMLVVAKEYDLIDKLPDFRVPTPPRTAVVALARNEAKAFLEKARTMLGPELSVLLEIYLRTGLRAGEGLALYPADFNLRSDRPTLRVSRSYGAYGYGPTKSRKERVVPMPHTTAGRVDKLLHSRGLSPHSKTEHLFLGRTGRPYCREHVLDTVKRVGDAADITRIHTHMLRHTFGTECARRGVPVLTIAAWMGHAKVATTMRYVHLCTPDHLQWSDLLDD